MRQRGRTKFVVEEGNSKYFSQNGVLYGYDEEGRQILISYPKAKEDTTYTVLEGTLEIGHNAFYYREKLEEIILPQSLEVLGNSSAYKNVLCLFDKDFVKEK